MAPKHFIVRRGIALNVTDPAVSVYFNTEDAVFIPSGNTGQRPDPAEVGMFRYNTELSQFEGFNGAEWEEIGAGGEASLIDFTSAGDIEANDVQSALEELDADKADISDLLTEASEISFTPSGNISASDVQSALEELDDEKADVSDLPTDDLWSDITRLALHTSIVRGQAFGLSQGQVEDEFLFDSNTTSANTYDADSSPEKAGIAVIHSGNLPIGNSDVDLVPRVSRDGGSTWSNGTFSHVEDYDTSPTQRLYEAYDIDLTGQPSGNSMKWRLETANTSYSTNIHSLVLNWS